MFPAQGFFEAILVHTVQNTGLGVDVKGPILESALIRMKNEILWSSTYFANGAQTVEVELGLDTLYFMAASMWDKTLVLSVSIDLPHLTISIMFGGLDLR